jgi:hypothetical protein
MPLKEFMLKNNRNSWHIIMHDCYSTDSYKSKGMTYKLVLSNYH